MYGMQTTSKATLVSGCDILGFRIPKLPLTLDTCVLSLLFIPMQVCSGSTGDGIQMALAHTNLHWGMLAVAQPNSHTRRGSSPAMVAGNASSTTVAAAGVAALEAKRRGTIAPVYA